MKQIQSQYSVKDIGPPKYYLGLDYKQNAKGKWLTGCYKFIRSAINKVERIHGVIPNQSIPCIAKDHPEKDQSKLLGTVEHQQYQQLIRMLSWVVQLGRFNIAFATSSLSRFSAAPSKGHL